LKSSLISYVNAGQCFYLLVVLFVEVSERRQKVKEVFEEMRGYQKDVFKVMVRDKRHLNYLDMGMGKSLATSMAIMYLEAFPCIIVCTKSAIYVWEEELRKWFGEEATMYLGKPKQRDAAWKDFVVKGHKFIITNYSLAQELGQRFGIDTAPKPAKGSSTSGTTKQKLPPTPGTKWHVGGIIADEIQRAGLFNHKTKTYEMFKKLIKDIPTVFLLTGTPYRRGVVDFYAPLSLVAPQEFNSYWSFVGKHCRVIDTGFGKSIERNPKDIVGFRTLLRQYASIMKKEDHLDELPGKIRQAIPVTMDDEQARVYNELTEQLMAQTDNGEYIMTPGVLSLMVRQRQLLVCPQELGLQTRGAAIDAMLEMCESQVEEAKPFVIFTAFKDGVRWIDKALRETYPGLTTFHITGGLTPEQFRDAWKGFQDFTGTGPRVLICVIRSSASFHATVADTAYVIGPEWDFNQNEQAEDRLNRMGQKKLVTCYYFGCKGTIDDHVITRLNDKKFTADLILSEEEVFQKMWDKLRGNTVVTSHLSFTAEGMQRTVTGYHKGPEQGD
jgi:SWI/SNF-related matrix-associated actin-dependent regulator 1 of chromatin subfamily A